MTLPPPACLVAYIGPGPGGFRAKASAIEELVVFGVFGLGVLCSLFLVGLACSPALRAATTRAAQRTVVQVTAGAVALLAVLAVLAGIGFLLLVHPVLGGSLLGLIVASVVYARFWITTPRSWPA